MVLLEEYIGKYLTSVAVHTFRRSVLQRLLAKHLHLSDRLHLHFSKRLTHYTELSSTSGESHSPLLLHFKDGTSVRCDLLIGSDGIRSAVRRTMFTLLANEAGGHHDKATELRSMIEPVWSGQVAYRGLTPAAVALREGVKGVDKPMIVSIMISCRNHFTLRTDAVDFDSC